MPAEDDVLAAAEARAAALASGDIAALTHLLHPQFAWTSHTGESFDRAAYIRSNTHGPITWHGQRLEGVTIAIVGDTAILRCTVVDDVSRGVDPAGTATTDIHPADTATTDIHPADTATTDIHPADTVNRDPHQVGVGPDPAADGNGPAATRELFRMPMTQVWVRTPDGWKCLAGHAGPRLPR